MDKLPGHKERSLAWLRGLEEAVKSWRQPDNLDHLIGLEDAVPTRWTAKSVSDHYAMEPVSIVTFHRLTSHISGLLHQMIATPDAISQEDVGALGELVRLRTNLEVVLNAKIRKS